jgi:phage repressor protein C with HTH and peptisase S24 domain
MENMATRLTRLLDIKNGGNQSELARFCGVTPQAVQKWIAGQTEPRGANLERAAEFLGVSQSELKFGTAVAPSQRVEAGPFFLAEPTDYAYGMSVAEGEGNSIQIRKVKLRLRAGYPGFQTEPDMAGAGEVSVPRELIAALRLDPANLLAMAVRGDSMEPMMFEDDVVIIDKSDTKPISRELYAVNFDGEPLIKQLLYRGGQWYLHSLNGEYEDTNVRSGQTSIVGRVVIQPTRVLTGRL